MSCHFTMVSVRWVRHGVIFRLGWTNIHDMLFSVPILTVTILTLNCKPNPDPINTKTNLNPNPQNPNHNLTPRTENSLEQIQLSVLGDGKYNLYITFRSGRTNIHDRRYLPSMGTRNNLCIWPVYFRCRLIQDNPD